MATVNKDFRIKAGLVVEGANATVNGEDIITTGSSTDDLQEGSTNLYFTNQRALDAVGGDISSAVSTAIDALDTDDIEEGSSNLYFTNQRAIDAVGGSATDANTPDTVVKRDASGNFAAGTITANRVTYGTAGYVEDDGSLIVEATDSDLRLNAADDIRLYAQDVINIETVAGTINFDAPNADVYINGVTAVNKVATEGYVDTAIGNIDLTYTTDDVTEGTNLYYTDARVDSHLSGTYPIEYNAGDISLAVASGYGLATDEGGLYIDRTVVNTWYDANGAAATAESNANSYTDTAVSNLVNGAPELLDTLNELAAAINDDASFASTIATQIGEKVAKSGDTMTGELVLAADPTQSLAAATKQYVDSAASGAYNDAIAQADTTAQGYANTAENNAESYADSLAANYEPAGAVSTAINALTTDDIEEGSGNLYFTDERAIDAVSAADIYPNAVIINNVSKTVANTQSVATASTVSGITWAKADYRSAKLVVKASTASHSQVSEIMVTLDSLDNIAITEFGIVYTDTELATITADVSGTDVRVRVTTLNATTAVTVVGTLLV